MKNTSIAWATHTFNPWRGCTKVSAGCANCYAEAGSKRNPGVLGEWGPQGTRVVASETMWRQPRAWDREARAAGGERPRVFCASLADVFEGRETMPQASWPAVEAARARLFHLISETPHLDWLLLTKRPANVARMCGGFGVPRTWSESMPPNVWLGTSVEDQDAANERVPHLLASPPCAVRFLSMEPLLGPVDLTHLPGLRFPFATRLDALAGHLYHHDDGGQRTPHVRLDWVIVGGESGSQDKARPFDLQWADAIVGACRLAGVPCFVKQLGTRPRADGLQLRLIGHKGGDIEEWPVNLQVREMPEAR